MMDCCGVTLLKMKASERSDLDGIRDMGNMVTLGDNMLSLKVIATLPYVAVWKVERCRRLSCHKHL